MNQKSQNYFNPRLEAIRGCAAFMVAVFHSYSVFDRPGLEHKLNSAVTALFNGHSAVTIFFVLSGLVLGLGFRRAPLGASVSGRGFLTYAWRRLFRIYPVFFVSTLIVFSVLALQVVKWGGVMWLLNSGIEYHSRLLNGIFPDASVAFQNLGLLSASLNPVTWTLGVEMFCSLLLPIAHYIHNSFGLAGRVGVIAFCVIPVVLKFVGLLPSGLVWLSYFFLFWAGYLIPELKGGFCQRIKGSSVLAGMLLICSLILLLIGGRVEKLRIIQGIGAFGVIWLACECSEFGFWKCLDFKVVRFYGAISYSFYLFHDLVLVSTARGLAALNLSQILDNNSVLTNTLLMVVSVIVTTILANYTCKYIEQPFIRIGKDTAVRMFGLGATRKF